MTHAEGTAETVNEIQQKLEHLAGVVAFVLAVFSAIMVYNLIGTGLAMIGITGLAAFLLKALGLYSFVVLSGTKLVYKAAKGFCSKVIDIFF